MMRKRLILLGALLLIASDLHAAPVGRKVASEHRWSLGAVASTDNLKMKSNAGSNFAGELRSNLLLAEATYAFNRDAEVVLRLGGSLEKYRDVAGYTRGLATKMDWGIGVRGVMYEGWTGWRLIGDAQYFSRPNRHFGVADIDIRSIQAAAAVELDVNAFKPYLGFYGERLDVTSNNGAAFPSLRSKNVLGSLFGVGLEISPEWQAFGEARLLNGYAFSGGIHRRF